MSVSVSSQIILEALEDAAGKAVDEGRLDPGVYEGAPQSVVFYPEPGEPWDEDDVAAICAVCEDNVAAKIAYWQRVLDGQRW